MDDNSGYAVFFFPQALEALGDAIKPYLQGGPAGEHVVCREIDTGGALIEMTLDGQTTGGQTLELELMVPSNMVRMIVSARGEEAFGFGPRIAVPVVVPAEAVSPPALTTAPAPVDSTATPADAAPVVPAAATQAPEAAPPQTPPKP